MAIAAFVVVPALLQLMFAAIVMAATTGDGSFVGLAAMLLGLMGIPVTAALNFAVSRAWTRAPGLHHVALVLLLTAVYPGAILALWILAS